MDARSTSSAPCNCPGWGRKKREEGTLSWLWGRGREGGEWEGRVPLSRHGRREDTFVLAGGGEGKHCLPSTIRCYHWCRTVKVRATEPYYIRATFPPLRHLPEQRHQCIHRLINHVYNKRQLLFNYCPTTWWQLG